MKYDRKIIASTRTDLRILACIAIFYRDNQSLSRTKSSLIGDVLEDFALILEKQKKSIIPIAHTKALKILRECNFNFYDKSESGGLARDVVETLAQEEFALVEHEEVDIRKAVLDTLEKKGKK